MFPRYGSYPGFNPIVELSMTFHTQVVGANGQRQAMAIERMPGLAEVILSNFTFGPKDVMIVFSAGGTTAVPGGDGPRRRGGAACGSIAVTSVAQIDRRPTSIRPSGAGSLDEADLVIDLCTPHADAMVHVEGLDTPVGPGSTIAAVAIVNSIKVRIGRAADGAGCDAPGHHPCLRGRRGTLADAVRRGLPRARAADRSRDRPVDEEVGDAGRSHWRPGAHATRPRPRRGRRSQRRRTDYMNQLDGARRFAGGSPRVVAIVGACSATSGAQRRPAPAPASYTIGFSNPGGVGNGWREEMLCSAKAQAVKAGNVAKVTIIHRDTDAAGQLADIRTLIAQGVNAIIINPADPDALNPGIAEAIAAKASPVIAVDASVTAPGAYNLSNDQEKYGYLGAKWLFEQARRQGQRRLHARHRRPPGRHRPRQGLQAGARREPGHQGRQGGRDRAGIRPTATQQINDILSGGEEFDGIWTSGIDSNIVDALKTANHDFVPIVGADNAGFVTQLLNEARASRARPSPTRRPSAAPASTLAPQILDGQKPAEHARST